MRNRCYSTILPVLIFILFSYTPFHLLADIKRTLNFIQYAPKQSLETTVIYDVPFTSQAPNADWDDDRFQNACEEASIYMTAKFLKKESITKDIAEDEIISITESHEDLFGEYKQDTNYYDTAKLFVDYTKYTDIKIGLDISKNSLIKLLYNGYIIMVPTNGQKLYNPNFKSPGPEYHMVLIIGYNPDANQFIVNDPGTRNGKHYTYDEDILFNAIQDYKTGNHEGVIENSKNAIAVKVL